MKRFITILLFACVALCAAAQDGMLEKIIAANTFDSVQASFSQVRHSSLMTDDLKSEGKVWLQTPDKVRWEVTGVSGCLLPRISTQRCLMATSSR